MVKVRCRFRGDLLVPAEALGRQEVVRRVAQGVRVPADARLARQQSVRSQEPQLAQTDVVSDLPVPQKGVKPEWRRPDREKIISFLVNEHSFSLERVEAALDRVMHAKSGESETLEKWFE